MGRFLRFVASLALLHPVWSAESMAGHTLSARANATNPHCNELSTKKYGRNDSYIPMIDYFCQHLIANGTRKPPAYYQGELREVKFSLEGPSTEVNNDTCHSSLRSIIDDCDIEANNTMGWKAGGKFKAGANLTFSIEPQTLRHSPPTTPLALCVYDASDVVSVKGLGWNGAYLKDAAKEKFGLNYTFKPLTYFNESESSYEFEYLAKLPEIGTDHKADFQHIIDVAVSWKNTTYTCNLNTTAIATNYTQQYS